jgi:predicted phage tail protein
METGLIPAHVSLIDLPERTAAETTLAVRGTRIVEVLNPFRCEASDLNELTVEEFENESLGALLERTGFDAARYRVSMNGAPVEQHDLGCTAVLHGAEILLFPAIGGGGWRGILGAVVGLIAIGALLFFTAGTGLAAVLGSSSWMLGALFSTGAALGSALMSWALAPGLPSAPAYSLTYDPTGPKSLAQPGTPVPKGYGVMQWGGNVISSYVAFDGPDAYIYALVCYGFGQAVSVGNILLNNKPISEYNGTMYTVRLGTNTQTPMSGFNQTYNGFPQQTQMLVSNGPVTVSGTGTDVEGVQVTVKFPSGLYRVTGDGNYVPLKLIYTIAVSPHGQNAWTQPMFPDMAAVGCGAHRSLCRDGHCL